MSWKDRREVDPFYREKGSKEEVFCVKPVRLVRRDSHKVNKEKYIENFSPRDLSYMSHDRLVVLNSVILKESLQYKISKVRYIRLEIPSGLSLKGSLI